MPVPSPFIIIKYRIQLEIQMGESILLKFFSSGRNERQLSGNSADGDDSNVTAEVTFTIIFYGLFVAMLIAFWFVFKRGAKHN